LQEAILKDVPVNSRLIRRWETFLEARDAEKAADLIRNKAPLPADNDA
jgi:hypothetical protein